MAEHEAMNAKGKKYQESILHQWGWSFGHHKNVTAVLLFQLELSMREDIRIPGMLESVSHPFYGPDASDFQSVICTVCFLFEIFYIYG